MTKKPEILKENLIQKKNGLYYKENESTPFTGRYEGFYEIGELKCKTISNFKNGKENGLYEEYQNGKLVLKINFKDGKKDGLLQSYHENGQLRSKRYYKDGQIIDQIAEIFYSDGRLSSRKSYKDGLLHGIFESYDSDKRKKSDSKRLWSKWNYKKGELHGVCESYYPEGDQIICLRTTYHDGKRIEEKKFRRNGVLESKIIGDYQNYTQESYDEKGKFRSKFMFKNGKYFYDEDYKLIPKFIYKDGKIIDDFGHVLYPILGRQAKSVRAKLSKLLKVFLLPLIVIFLLTWTLLEKA